MYGTDVRRAVQRCNSSVVFAADYVTYPFLRGDHHEGHRARRLPRRPGATRRRRRRGRRGHRTIGRTAVTRIQVGTSEQHRPRGTRPFPTHSKSKPHIVERTDPATHHHQPFIHRRTLGPRVGESPYAWPIGKCTNTRTALESHADNWGAHRDSPCDHEP